MLQFAGVIIPIHHCDQFVPMQQINDSIPTTTTCILPIPHIIRMWNNHISSLTYWNLTRVIIVRVRALLNTQCTLISDIKFFLKVYFNVKIHADFKSVGSQTQKLSVLQNPCFKWVDIRGEHESIYKSVTPNYVRRDIIQQHSPTFRWNRLRLKLMFAKVTQNCDWDILYRHTPMYNYSLAYTLAWMEFTTLIIMVGHLDPDTPLTNVILWRVILISRISVQLCNSSATHLLTGCIILNYTNYLCLVKAHNDNWFTKA